MRCAVARHDGVVVLMPSPQARPWVAGSTIALCQSAACTKAQHVLKRVANHGIGYGHACMRLMPLRLAAAVAIVVLSTAAPAAGQATTTAPAATTTVATTVATTAPPTTTATSAVTTTTPASTTTTTTVTTTTHPAKTSGGMSGSTIAIIIVVVVVVLALVFGVFFLVTRSRQRSQWSERAQAVAGDARALASAVERGLPLLRDPGSAAQVWVDLNTRLAHVRSGLGTLNTTASDPRARAATTRATQALDALQASIDTDRGLRMGPPPPTEDQIAYSEALLSQRAVELGRAADELLGVTTPS